MNMRPHADHLDRHPRVRWGPPPPPASRRRQPSRSTRHRAPLRGTWHRDAPRSPRCSTRPTASAAAFFAEDGAAIGDILATLPALGEAALAAAPPEIADAVADFVAPLPELAAAAEGSTSPTWTAQSKY